MATPDYEAIGRYTVATENLEAAVKERSRRIKGLRDYLDKIEAPAGEHRAKLLDISALQREMQRLADVNGEVQQAAAEAVHSSGKAGRAAIDCRVENM